MSDGLLMCLVIVGHGLALLLGLWIGHRIGHVEGYQRGWEDGFGEGDGTGDGATRAAQRIAEMSEGATTSERGLMDLPDKYNVTIIVSASDDDVATIKVKLHELKRSDIMSPDYKSKVITAIVRQFEEAVYGYKEEAHV